MKMIIAPSVMTTGNSCRQFLALSHYLH